MRRAAAAVWQAARQHAAAGRASTSAADLAQTLQLGCARCLSSSASAVSVRLAPCASTAATAGCSRPPPQLHADHAVSNWLDIPLSAALLHSRQLHSRQLHGAAASNGLTAFHASPPLRCSSGSSGFGSSIAVQLGGRSLVPPSLLRAAATLHSAAHSPSHHRAYASRATQALTKGHAAGPAGSQQVSMRIAVASPNQLAEPYTGTPSKLPFLQSWFTPAGWKARWARGMAGAKSMYTIRACKKNIPGFSLPAFKAEALKTYSAICASLATGNVNALRQLTTSGVFSEMKRELRNREAAGWARVAWGLVQKPELNAMEVVHGRLIYMNPKDDSSAFAQLTVRLASTQRFAAYDARGRLLAGDPDGTVPVTDLWVFEVSLRKSVANRWRLAARLNPALK